METMLAITPAVAPASEPVHPWLKHLQPDTAPEGFRSEAEIKALRILDEMEQERNDLLLQEMGGRRCAKRQLRAFHRGFSQGLITLDGNGDILQEIVETTI